MNEAQKLQQISEILGDAVNNKVVDRITKKIEELINDFDEGVDNGSLSMTYLDLEPEDIYFHKLEKVDFVDEYLLGDSLANLGCSPSFDEVSSLVEEINYISSEYYSVRRQIKKLREFLVD